MLWFLLHCWIIAGFTAGEPTTRHYRVKNSTLCLQVEKSPPYTDVRWSFDNNIIVINNQTTPRFQNKVVYNPKNLSLCIYKLTEEDSGTYTVSITDSDFRISTETHRLIVQEAVPRPLIRMSIIHSNLSAGFCNVSVTCSIGDKWVRSFCDKESCSTPQRSIREVNFTVFTDNSTIVCHANNHVSTSNVSKSFEAICIRKSGPECEETPHPPIVMIIIVVTAIAVGVPLCVFIVWVAKRCISTERKHHQAQASTVINSEPLDAQPRPVRMDSTSSSDEAEASYENVDAAESSQTSSPREELESTQKQKVDTVYCFVQMPNASLEGDGSRAEEEPNNIPQAPTSQPVPLGEEEPPAEIDTVYSLLQKPKNKISKSQTDEHDE